MSEFYTSVQRYGNNILYRGLRNNRPFQDKIKFSPTMYRRDDKGTLRGIRNEKLSPITFDTMREYRDFVNAWKDVPNSPNSSLYGMDNFIFQYITERYPEEIKFDISKIRVCTIDIEVASDSGFPYPEQADHSIISIACKYSTDSKYYIWGLGEYKPKPGEVYKQCLDETHLLKDFLNHWSNNPPDVITGWNTRFFDIPYIINRYLKVFGEETTKRFSPWGLIESANVTIAGKENVGYKLVGIAQLDYMELFKKFGNQGPQESYKLDNIAASVLGERKLSYEEYGSLHTLYKEDHQKFIEYNVRDVELVERLDNKLQLISLAMTIAYSAGVNYEDTLGTLAVWDAMIYRMLLNDGVVCPPKKQNHHEAFAGGYVKDPHVGMHDWVVSFDLASLYPNIIIQWNMSPETLVEDKHMDLNPNRALTLGYQEGPYCIAANGTMYHKEKTGVIPEAVEKVYKERKLFKAKMLEAKNAKDDALATYYNIQQQVRKIMINSLYGALGSPYFRYFDLRMAEAVTLTGQTVIRWAERASNAFMNTVCQTEDKDYVIAIDTDSIYVNFGRLVDLYIKDNHVDTIDKVCKEQFEPMLAKSYDELCKTFNCTKSRMEMDREVIADRGIWTAKKRYILNVHDNEGVRYDPPTLKVMGIEAVRSSTPGVCRSSIKELMTIIMTKGETETQQYIQEFRNHFKSLPVEDISFPRGANNLQKFSNKKTIYSKGTPIQVRGVLLYNYYLEKYGLQNRYQKIPSGDKIKFVHLLLPNPIKEDVIAFSDFLPTEMKLHKYVDYDTMFQKAFLDPIESILKSIGWTAEEQISLEDFFG